MARTQLGDMPVGNIVTIKISGVKTDFIIVHQGLPSDEYGASANGTWLLEKVVHGTDVWGSSGCYYSNSTIKTTASNYKSKVEGTIRNQIRSINVPYTAKDGNTIVIKKTVVSIFPLSAAEMGLSSTYIRAEGVKLDYFNVDSGAEACNRRIAFYEGNATEYWTRTRYHSSTHASTVDATGQYGYYLHTGKRGLRFAFVLSPDVEVLDDGSLYANTAPTIPSSISVPSEIQGGSSISISWDASSDAENNLEGYIVQRSVDGGSSWSQIYQGSGRSATNTVAFGTQTVMYRVKAYDAEGLQSGWRTSSQITVNNNTAPTAPASITVPDAANGGQALTISWGASSDQEGNLAGYKLERQVNGGSWSEIYEGPNTSYTDTIVKGWNSVGYRVCAYDTLGAASGYVTGTTRTVNNNTAPTISGQDAVLGLKTGGFSQTYTVSDAENDTVTVSEYVDNSQIRSYTATLGQQATATITREMWLTLTNGDHQLRVEATDGNATTARIWTFSKKETVICFRLAAPEETDTAATKVLVSPTWQITGAAAKVEACNNAFDANPAWEDITAMIALGRVYNFTNKTKTADKWGIDFRFTITKNENYDGEVSITGFGGAYE